MNYRTATGKITTPDERDRLVVANQITDDPTEITKEQTNG